MTRKDEHSSIAARMQKYAGSVLGIRVSLIAKVVVGYCLILLVLIFAACQLAYNYSAFLRSRDKTEKVYLPAVWALADLEVLFSEKQHTEKLSLLTRKKIAELEMLIQSEAHRPSPPGKLDEFIAPLLSRLTIPFIQWTMKESFPLEYKKYLGKQADERKAKALLAELKRAIRAGNIQQAANYASKLKQVEENILRVEKAWGYYKGSFIYLLAYELGFGGLLVILAGWLFTKFLIVHPIRTLISTTDAIAKGDLEKKVKIPFGDEFGVLASRFNQMTQVLKETIYYQRQQIEKILHFVSKVKEGNLTERMPVEGDDAFGNLADSLNQMTNSLMTLAMSIKQATASLNSSTMQIKTSADEQDDRISQQRSQISEVASSVDQLASAAKQIAESTQQVARSAEHAQQAALFGGTAVKDSVSAMQEIKQTANATSNRISELGERSQVISKVIDDISGIAEQINLLALNAAIEAARAGEAGKGFAVVADEVRKLAERSARAAEDIAALISSIQKDIQETIISMESGTKKVDKGVERIQRAGSALDEIIQAISDTADRAKEITISTKEQMQGAQEVSLAMESLRQVMRQSEIAARQTKEAAEELANLSEKLNVTVSGFKT